MASSSSALNKHDDFVHSEKIGDEYPCTEPSDGTNVPAGYFPVTAEEKALSRSLNRKLDIFLLPFLSLLYLFNGLDRGNVGNAETQGVYQSHHYDVFTKIFLIGFTKDIGAKSSDLNQAVSLFFVTFVIFQPISSGIGRRVGAKNWIPFIMVCSTISGYFEIVSHRSYSLYGVALPLPMHLFMAVPNSSPCVF